MYLVFNITIRSKKTTLRMYISFGRPEAEVNNFYKSKVAINLGKSNFSLKKNNFFIRMQDWILVH